MDLPTFNSLVVSSYKMNEFDYQLFVTYKHIYNILMFIFYAHFTIF
jgi:hypothetical protein